MRTDNASFSWSLSLLFLSFLLLPMAFFPYLFFYLAILTFWKFWNFSSFKPFLCIPTMIYFFPDVFLSIYYFSPFTHCLIILFCRSQRLVQHKLLKSGSCLLDGCVLIAVYMFLCFIYLSKDKLLCQSLCMRTVALEIFGTCQMPTISYLVCLY